MAFCCCEQDQDLDFWYMGNRFDSSIWSTFAYLEKGFPQSSGNICYLDPLNININKEKDWPVINRWVEMKGEWTYKYGLWQEGFSAGTITPEDVYGIWTRELTDKVPNVWPNTDPDWNGYEVPFYVTKTQIRGNGFKWRHNPANRCLSTCPIKSVLCDPQYPERNVSYDLHDGHGNPLDNINPCTKQPWKICDCYNSDIWNGKCGKDWDNLVNELFCSELLGNPSGSGGVNLYNLGANRAYWQFVGIPGTTSIDVSKAVHRSSVHDLNRLVSSEEYHMANRPQYRSPEIVFGHIKDPKWYQSPYTHYFDCTKGGNGTGDQDPNLVWCPSGICRNAVCSRPGLEYCCKSQEYFKVKEVEGITFTLPGLTREHLIGGWDIQCAIAARESELCLYEAKAFRMYTPMEIDKTPTPPFWLNKSWKSTEPVYHPGKTFDNCNDLCEEFKFPDLDCQKANNYVWRDSSYITSAPNDWQTNEFKSNDFNPSGNPQMLEGQCWACIRYWDYPWRRSKEQPYFSSSKQYYWIDTPECGESTGNCCTANPGIRGCSVSDCCIRVCYYNPECCTDEWGITCANIAKQYCPSCGAPKTDYGPFSPYGLLGYSTSYCTGGSLIPNSCDCKRENIKLPGFTYGIDIVSGPNYLDQIIKTSPYDWKAISLHDGISYTNSPSYKTAWFHKSKHETNVFKCDNCTVGTSDGHSSWGEIFSNLWPSYISNYFKPSSTASVFDWNWRVREPDDGGTDYNMYWYAQSATTDLAFIPPSLRLYREYHAHQIAAKRAEEAARYNLPDYYTISSYDSFPHYVDHNPYFWGEVDSYSWWGESPPARTNWMPTPPYVNYLLRWNDNAKRYTWEMMQYRTIDQLWTWEGVSEGNTFGKWDGFSGVGFGYVPSNINRYVNNRTGAHRQVFYDGESSCSSDGGGGGGFGGGGGG